LRSCSELREVLVLVLASKMRRLIVVVVVGGGGGGLGLLPLPRRLHAQLALLRLRQRLRHDVVAQR